MLRNTVNTSNFIADIYGEELKDMNIKLDKMEIDDNKRITVYYSYDYKRKRYESNFVMGTQDTIIGWNGMCKVLEMYNNQWQNFNRYANSCNLTFQPKIVRESELDKERRSLEEIDFDFSQEEIYDYLTQATNIQMFIIRFSNDKTYMMEDLSVFTNPDSQTVVILKRMLYDLLIKIGETEFNKDIFLVTLYHILEELYSNNIDNISRMVSKYDINIKRESNGVVSIEYSADQSATTSLLKEL